MEYHTEQDYTVCSNVLIPYLKTYCRTGFYVSVPFTAREYYVVVKDPVDPWFVAYKVILDDEITFDVPTDEELEEVKKALRRATKCFEAGGGECEEEVREMSKEASKKNICMTKVFRESKVKINDVKKIKQSIVDRLNQAVTEVRGQNVTIDDVPEDIKPYISLGRRPNVVVYPNAKPTEIEELPILNEFVTYKILCKPFLPDREKLLRIPVAPPFDTKLYEIVASAEVTNRCSNETIKNHIKCFLAYKVSRAVAYH